VIKVKQRVDKALKLLSPCRVCPRRCGVNRLEKLPKKLGFCRAGRQAIVHSYHPHHGEERCLRGRSGSGTIFFSSCNLACVYCQNWEISQLRLGRPVTAETLAKMMLELQGQGCHNINLVSPTIWVPQILEALLIAREKGLKLPLVYNTGGYDAVKTLKLLEGIVDIYMPDIKYADNKTALKYSLVPNYWPVVQKAVKEMYRQVGDLVIDKQGLAKKGLLIRHLVLPENLAGTKKVMKFIAEKISKNAYVNIMDQYHPSNKSHRYPKINRRITSEEFEQALDSAKEVGLH
jgi:putative pyruvate formate lyase activating enzyme